MATAAKTVDVFEWITHQDTLAKIGLLLCDAQAQAHKMGLDTEQITMAMMCITRTVLDQTGFEELYDPAYP